MQSYRKLLHGEIYTKYNNCTFFLNNDFFLDHKNTPGMWTY